MSEHETPASAQLTPRQRSGVGQRIARWLRRPRGRATPATLRPVENEAQPERSRSIGSADADEEL